MNEKMGESLSALMDDEANELELERVLSKISDDDGLRLSWSRFSQTQHAIHGHQLAHLDCDISRRVQLAIGNGLESVSEPEAEGIKQRLMRPLISLAVAASVAATVVIGGQQLALVSGVDSHEADHSVATSASPSCLPLVHQSEFSGSNRSSNDWGTIPKSFCRWRKWARTNSANSSGASS